MSAPIPSTSYAEACARGRARAAGTVTDLERSDFITGYVDACLWANTLQCDADGEVIAGEVDPDAVTLTAEAESALRQDVADFLTRRVIRLIRAATRRDPGYDFDHAGVDLALSRNGHGAGYFDRGLGFIGDALQDLARAEGERHLWVDVDGQVSTS